jgi:cold shock CspA family protein
VVASLLVLGLALVASAALAEGNEHDVQAELVSFDAKAKTVTFKTEDGKQKTAPVMESALAGLQSMKPGQKVVFTCADDEEGEHLGVSKVRPAKVEKG